ncbi:antigen 5 like allergen Cul n 1-like [Culicoides brevitarsis]|uniref:antigen 5 like allergen Cul n 1-like n=1 Tax=Culicoides brevitarsis TaxID=469753 RepID=UPI00307B727E
MASVRVLSSLSSSVSSPVAIFLALNVIFVNVVLSVDYCSIQKEKCNNKPHIGCSKKSTFQFNNECYDMEVIPMTQGMKDAVVNRHNQLRNKLAAGKTPKYPSASRMKEIFWDDELESVACQHVKWCQFDHDSCRATRHYDNPGQNLRKSSDYVHVDPDHEQILVETTDDWFNEYSNVASDIVDKYSSGRSWKLYGHFTVMSRDVQDRMGCCMVQYLHYERNYWWRNTLVTCNYRETNFISEPVYIRGPPTSDCRSWGPDYKPSVRYPFLCTNVR